MKNFTSLIIILLLCFTTSANYYPELQERIQQKQEKFKSVLDFGQLLLQTNTASLNQWNSGINLKNATATLKLDSIVTRMCDQEGTWQYEWKQEFLYNAGMNNTVLINKEWDIATNSWLLSERMKMEFDNQGRIHSLLTYVREEADQELELTSKTEVTYDASGRPESIMFYSPDEDSGWVLELKQEYSYDASGKIDEANVWTMEEEELIKTMRIAYSYDASGNIELMETFYIMEGIEMLFSKSQMSYDAFDRLIVEENWSLNYMSFTLEKNSRITTSYNAGGDISTEIYADWDSGSQTWVDVEKYEYTYGSASFTDVVFPSYFFLYVMIEDQSYTNHKIITEINTFKLVDDSWENTEKSNYYYSSGMPSDVDLTESADFSVFPNPASKYVKVSWTGKYDILSFEIFRIDGTKILEQPVYPGKMVPVSHLNRGMYFFRLVNGMETMYAGKLIRN